MANNKQKLELTWIGKNNPEYDIANIEPRILEERTDLSYGDKDTDNMIIHGDNLLALKALLPEYEGKVKCVYIDPPYNTGNAFEHYDDSVEHSTWLSLMKPRLELLRKLLDPEQGSIYVSIDDKEVHYLKLICDEVFGRDNYISTIAVKMSTASGVKTSHREKTLIKEKEFVLCYAYDSQKIKINPQYIPKIEWDDEFQYILEKSNSSNPDDWKVLRLKDELKKLEIPYDETDQKFKDFIINNANKIWRRAFIRNEYKELSQQSPEKVIFDQAGDNYYYRGRQMYFFKDRFHLCFTEEGYKQLPSYLLGDFWTDINTGKLFNEGGIDFRNGKKPEFLIARILELSTKQNDFVLDSFLGSGTTAAVAHKMGRKYIGIEMGEHAFTHCKARLDKVVDGTDEGGVSKAVEWKGSGGYKFYELAPSFVVIDEFGNPVIDSYYSDTKLIRAMCKLTNYTFSPSPTDYWKQGKGQGNNSIYITTQMLSVAMVQQIAGHLSANETLLICPKKFEPGAEKVDVRITIKKIPQSILKACQFGMKEYLLPIKEGVIEEIDDEVNSEEK